MSTGTTRTAARGASLRSRAWPSSRSSALSWKRGFGSWAAASITRRIEVADESRGSVVWPSSGGRAQAMRSLGKQEGGVARARHLGQPREHGGERFGEGLAGQDFLRGGHHLLEVEDAAPGPVPLLPQVVEGGAQLGRGLGIALDEGLLRAGIGPGGGGPQRSRRPGVR